MRYGWRTRQGARKGSGGLTTAETRTTAAILAIAALEGALLLGALDLATAPVSGPDGLEYERLGRSLADGDFDTVFRAPGYPALLAVLDRLGLGTALAARVVQLGLVAATALVVRALTATLFGGRAGGAAGVLTVSFLPLVWMATEHMTEVAAAFLVAVLALVLVRSGGRPVAGAVAAGATLAALAYLRPAFLLAAIPLAAGVAAATGRRPAAAFLAAVVIAVGPWTVRNALVTDHFVPLATGSGISLWVSSEQYAGRLGHSLSAADWRHVKQSRRAAARDLRRDGLSPRDELVLDDRLGARADWGAIGAVDLGRGLAARTATLWGPADHTPAGLAAGVSLRRLAIAQWLLLAGLALLGGALARGRLRAAWPLLALPAYVWALHLVFHSEPRYTVPVWPLLLAFAGFGAAGLWARRGGPRAP